MREEMAFGTAVADEHDEELELSDSERRLIDNVRMMKESAQEMLLDLSEQYRRTLPMRRVELRVVGPS